MIDKVADGESTDCRLLILEAEFKRLSAQIARASDFSPLLRKRLGRHHAGEHHT